MTGQLSGVPCRYRGFVAALLVVVVGCGPNYRELRMQGQRLMLQGEYGTARVFLRQAEERRPQRIDNLHDLGVCSMMQAQLKFNQLNYPAAMREIDAAIDYYSRALKELPGHLASLEGRNIALEQKGRFEAALEQSKWAAQFVGPSARQFLFLAQDLEERNDKDGALLRYRQAVVVEPNNAEAHRAFARFLLKHRNERAALFHLQTAYRLDPANAWVQEQLAARGGVPAEADSADTRTP